MENKDYISIFDEQNNMKIMESICVFKLKNYSSNYIIYSELDKSHYYLGKYNGIDITDLNTDFDDEEFEFALKVFQEVVK